MDQQIQLGKYRLFHHLASGGMGEVFLAVNEGPAGFSKTVVVKRILASVASDPAFVTMFLNEARIAAMIEHPNVVQIFELGLEENTYFIAMEYVHGRSLRHVRYQLVEQKLDLAPELAARICSQALQGLHHAHTLTGPDGKPLQIVHRDVSPDNLLIGFSGVVKVVDFGIAKAAVNVSTTRAGAVKGKYAYMAPEHLTGAQLDGRADVYGMGVVLYELLAGQRPFHASSEPGLIRAILQDDAPPPIACRPGTPEPLNRIAMKAIARNPDERFASAEEMSLALETFIQSTGKTVTHAHIGALLRQLFPEDAARPTPVPPSPRSLHPVSFGLTPGPGSQASHAASSAAAEAHLPEIEVVVDDDQEPFASRLGRTGRWIALGLGGAALLAATAILVPTKAPLTANGPAGEMTAAPAAAGAVTTNGPAGEKTAAPAAAGAVTTNGPAGEKTAAVGTATAPLPPAPETEVQLAAAPVEKMPTREAPAADSTRRRRTRSRAIQNNHRSAREERPEPRQDKAVASTGKVALRVNPWAEVFYAGRSLGVTPMDPVVLPAGTQTLTLRNPNLELERKLSVNVLAGREVVLKADLLE